MVGAVVVRRGAIIGKGWHHGAGQPHAEVEALRDARRTDGAELYVTLEPCCTHGRTPPCTDAIIGGGIRRVFVAATDPNPKHTGRGYDILRKAGIEVHTGILEAEANRLNEAFNHWIVHRRPIVIAKAAMTLDGKIATASGSSKWITTERSRAAGMKLRQGADAILVGVNTVIADDPALTIRIPGFKKDLQRIILDPKGRTPRTAKLLNDGGKTTIVNNPINLPKLLDQLGAQNVTCLLVEGGGETHWQFFNQKLIDRVAFFYAPKILGGRDARKAVAGVGFEAAELAPKLRDVEWRRRGEDLMLTARVEYHH